MFLFIGVINPTGGFRRIREQSCKSRAGRRRVIYKFFERSPKMRSIPFIRYEKV